MEVEVEVEVEVEMEVQVQVQVQVEMEMPAGGGVGARVACGRGPETRRNSCRLTWPRTRSGRTGGPCWSTCRTRISW